MTEVLEITQPTALYRHFNADGVLLYVGITEHPSIRKGSHKKLSPWWPEVDQSRSTKEWFPNRELAAAAEKLAIKTERPRHNKVHAPRPPRPRAAQAGDRHGQDKTTFRPPPEIKEAAQKVLDEHPDWTLNDFLTACLALLARNPDAMLNRLASFRPERRIGRPRKKASPE